MKAKTHPGDEQKVATSSNPGTKASESMKHPGTDARGKADRKLEPTGLTVDDIAEQSAYDDDKADISHTAANSDRNRKTRKD